MLAVVVIVLVAGAVMVFSVNTCVRSVVALVFRVCKRWC